MLRAESRGHNSLRSDKCPLFSNAFSREPRGSQAPGIRRLSLKPYLRCVVAGVKKRTAGSDTPSESAVLFYLCVIIQFDDN